MAEGTKGTRRRRARAPVRGAPIVRGVLGAALAELAAVGYGALRIEDVAARAGVNKTTVYRRWPTKADLIRAALLSTAEESMSPPSTGTLRGDLLAIGRLVADKCGSHEGRGLVRVVSLEGPDSELMAIGRSLRKTFEALPRAVIEAARARGELSQEIDGMLIFDLLAGAIHRRVFMDREAADEAYLVGLVDLLLQGALARAPSDRPARKPPASTRTRRAS